MIDERGGYEEQHERMGMRSAIMSSLEGGRFMWRPNEWMSHKAAPVQRMTDLGIILRLGCFEGWVSRGKRRKLMKIDDMVGQWIEAIVGMCLAHDKDAYDAHDAKADELLGPLLAAPIKQVREFYAKLVEAMHADKRVPMLVWMGFEAWGEVMVKDAPDEGIKRLKTKLAEEIAELVEEPIREQIPKAVARALRWRDPETLQAVKENLQAGGKPKLVGRESCLFLEIEPRKKDGKKVSVML